MRSSVETLPRSVRTSLTLAARSRRRAAKLTGMSVTLSGMQRRARLGRLGAGLLLLRDVSQLGDADDVAHLVLAEALGLEDQVERLVPGDVAQRDRHLPLDVVGDDDVLLRDVRDEPQQVPDVDVVELEGDAPAGVLPLPRHRRTACTRPRLRPAAPACACRHRRPRRLGGVPPAVPGESSRRARVGVGDEVRGLTAQRDARPSRRRDGWLKEEISATGPRKAAASTERSSLFGSLGSSSVRTMVRSSGREMACAGLSGDLDARRGFGLAQRRSVDRPRHGRGAAVAPPGRTGGLRPTPGRADRARGPRAWGRGGGRDREPLAVTRFTSQAGRSPAASRTTRTLASSRPKRTWLNAPSSDDRLTGRLHHPVEVDGERARVRELDDLEGPHLAVGQHDPPSPPTSRR